MLSTSAENLREAQRRGKKERLRVHLHTLPFSEALCCQPKKLIYRLTLKVQVWETEDNVTMGFGDRCYNRKWT